MKHFTTHKYWAAYNKLPLSIQKIADKNFALLKQNPWHPSLHLKKTDTFWSVRAGIHYRALGISNDDAGIIWFWIGSHADYDRLVREL